jgi:hypothetical protein
MPGRGRQCSYARSSSIAPVAEFRRDELRTVLEFLRKGDVLMVTRIDRLALSIPVFFGAPARRTRWRPSYARHRRSRRTLPRRKPRLLHGGFEVSHATA